MLFREIRFEKKDRIFLVKFCSDFNLPFELILKNPVFFESSLAENIKIKRKTLFPSCHYFSETFYALLWDNVGS